MASVVAIEPGPITAENYDQRVKWYGEKIRKQGDPWPFLSRNPDVPANANEYEWDRYFRDHLGGFPPSYRLFRDGAIRYFNVPEAKPETFDPSYQPRVIPLHLKD